MKLSFQIEQISTKDAFISAYAAAWKSVILQEHVLGLIF
jgi:hypothetical protein